MACGVAAALTVATVTLKEPRHTSLLSRICWSGCCIQINIHAMMVQHDAIIVFQCASSLYTCLDPWCTKHEINLLLVSSLVGVLESLLRIHPTNIMQIDEIALVH
jgi:hypothetical protein